jgi:hypothetical protein
VSNQAYRDALDWVRQIFLYKRPSTFGERFIGLFNREIGIAHVLSRAFYWWQATAFVKPPDSTLPYQGDTLDPAKTHVVLSSDDAIIPGEDVAAYLRRGNIPHTIVRAPVFHQHGVQPKLTPIAQLPRIHHAGFLMGPGPFLRVLGLITATADAVDPPYTPSTPSSSTSVVMLPAPASPVLTRRTSLTALPLRSPRSRSASLVGGATACATGGGEGRVLRPRRRRTGSVALAMTPAS